MRHQKLTLPLFLFLLFAASWAVLSSTAVSAADYDFTHTVTSSWGGGYCGDIVVTNNTNTAVNGWTLNWTFPGNQQSSSVWNVGSSSQTGATVTATDAGWNAAIGANGGSVTVGYCATGSSADPVNYALNGTVQPTATNAPPTATNPPATATNPAATATNPAATATSNPPTATATNVPPTATSVPPTATPGGGGCSAPAWTAVAYNGGDEVSHNGRSWRAKWWAGPSDEPGTGGQWGPWEDLGPCTAPTSTPLPTSTSVPPTATPGPSPTPSPTAVPSGDKEVVAYFTQWGIYGRDYHVKDIVTSNSADKITVINYAFANIVNGECVMTTQLGVMDAYADYQKSYGAADSVDGVGDVWDQPLKGNFNQLKKLKEMHPQIRVLISIGGWTWSDGFSDASLTQESRQRVVESCIDIYINGNLPVADGAGGPGAAAGVFDGIDIDWEYPAVPADAGHVYRPEDTVNFTLLLEEFRSQLDAIDPNLLLTIASPVGVDKYEKMELDLIHQHLDWINIMSYDMHGAWQNVTNFHAPVYTSPNDPSSYPANTYSIDTGVQAYLDAGIPANKIVLGIPFYGRGWQGVPNVNNGLYQTASGAAPGTYEAGIEDYKVLKLLNYPEFRDPITGAFWIYDGNTFWSYDDPTSIANKMNYINSRGLRGAMVWSLDGDDSNGTLMTAIHNGLTP